MIVSVPLHCISPGLSGRIVCMFPKCRNWQTCHTHWAFKVALCTLSSKLQTFPTVKCKDNWISSLSNPTMYSSSLLACVTSGERAAKRPLCGLFKSADTCFPTHGACDPAYVLQMCVSHHTSVERCKDITEHCY